MKLTSLFYNYALVTNGETKAADAFGSELPYEPLVSLVGKTNLTNTPLSRDGKVFPTSLILVWE